MVFGLLSLLMGHWIAFVAKICVESSTSSSKFYPCVVKKNNLTPGNHVLSRVKYPNDSFVKELVHTQKNEYCPEVILLFKVQCFHGIFSFLGLHL